ncbi:glycine cleavage system aminomethyltransferase GcvT [Simkania negevensis]|uniref:aminomethyltransferase n=1 Tax=Simkania negevensis TaxID=83561 RepID=A0ABS3APX5_9BACT|nr:glycine cleavage system aminomethyltransferase GcvT [Simkania negevensis]
MKTPLYERHLALAAKMRPFFGWEMPIEYRGVIAEHLHVRESVGLFDVSHMGQVRVQGKDAEPFLDYLSTNRIVGKDDGTAVYTVWADEDGMAVDDLLLFRESATSFLVVVNGSNRAKDLAHMQLYAKSFDVTVENLYETHSILALQGPRSLSVVEKILPTVANLLFMTFCSIEYEGADLIASATGYTGEKGFELYLPNRLAEPIWDRLMEEGRGLIAPVGLAARDTLRLEKGFALYGNELTEEISAVESVARWAVKLKKDAFVGKKKMAAIKESVSCRRQYGVVLDSPRIPRQQDPLFVDGEAIGFVTSGTRSPSLKKSIAIIMVDHPLEEGDRVQIEIRGKNEAATVVPLPFV